VFVPRTRCYATVAALLSGFSAGCGNSEFGKSPEIHLVLGRDRLPADGFSMTQIESHTPAGEKVTADLFVVEGQRAVRIDGQHLRSTINPGTAVIEARYRRSRARAVITTTPVYSDRAADGTPDFLRLDDAADREAFADSFSYLAEAQYFRDAGRLPREISDCSALIRYAYRESLREHNAEWASEVQIQHASSPAQPAKYYYPFTPLGPKLFRNRPGPFREADVRDKTFSEFADAESLRRYNTHFISRDIYRARRGDLLFYRQPDQRSPAHAMIFLGRSQMDGTAPNRVVYHTGPIGRDKGEIRRPAVDELTAHPQPQWRPLPGNSNFLGVYRWNILRQES
jgi:hypothetical protein